MSTDSILFVFKQSALRERALRSGGPGSYLLCGLPELRAKGYAVDSILERNASWTVRTASGLLGCICQRMTGYRGNFPQVLSSLSRLRQASALILTSNNSAFPVLFLRWMGVQLPPVFVISVGLEWNHPVDEKSRRRRAVGRLYNRAERVLVYSEAEKEFLETRVGINASRLRAIPFGIPCAHLPDRDATQEGESKEFRWEIISVGSDAQRDLPLLLDWGRDHPEIRIHLILGDDLRRELPALTENFSVESNLSLEEVFERLRSARNAVIPVRENRYSAGTTFLIHALASGLPTLVSKTMCLGPAYRIEESGCFTCKPGDVEDFARGMETLLSLSESDRRSRIRMGRSWVKSLADGEPLIREIESFLTVFVATEVEN